jgi:tetrapyrrole methylase family protein/MazG family protein
MAQGITIVGLGPGDPELLTLAAARALAEADDVYVRTEQHPTLDDSGIAAQLQGRLHAFDALYETYDSFAEVYAAIVAQVLALGEREQGVVYAVPGDPLVGEATVQALLTEAPSRGRRCISMPLTGCSSATRRCWPSGCTRLSTPT